MKRRSTKVSLSDRDIKIISAAIWHYARKIESANMPLTARKVLEAGDRFLDEVYRKEGGNYGEPKSGDSKRSRGAGQRVDREVKPDLR